MQNVSINDTCALLVIDMQYDFMPGGALAVAGGDELIPLVNSMAEKFQQVIFTQDWHPPGHVSFAVSHAGKQVFDSVTVGYGRQELWPIHCQMGSPGADLHADLWLQTALLVLRKGTNVAIDSYSAFRESDGHFTGLGGWLKEKGIQRLFICGLATDFCVRYSAEDAVAVGFETYVIEDACRAVDINGSLAAANSSMQLAGVKFIKKEQL